MAKVKTTKRKRQADGNTNIPLGKRKTQTKQRKLESKQNSSKTIQHAPIKNFAVPVSELKRQKTDSTKFDDTAEHCKRRGNGVQINVHGAKSQYTQDKHSKVKKRKFTGKQTKTWKLLNKVTHKYVSECLETGVGFIISKATNEGHKIDDIQNVLTHTVNLINDEMKTLRAPTKTYGDFRKITQIQKNASVQLRTINDHEETLEEIVREEVNTVRHLEKELGKLQTISTNNLQLHPFLCNFEPELHIPSVT